MDRIRMQIYIACLNHRKWIPQLDIGGMFEKAGTQALLQQCGETLFKTNASLVQYMDMDI